MWRPKKVDNEDAIQKGGCHSPVPLSPENKKARIDTTMLHDSPTTPGIYLPESYESPGNNTFGSYGFGQDGIRFAQDCDAGIHQNRKEYYASVSREAEESVNALERSAKNVTNTEWKVSENTSDNKENPFSSFFFSN
jgi:hypothetical protein